jgi:hypothetical protein
MRVTDPVLPYLPESLFVGQSIPALQSNTPTLHLGGRLIGAVHHMP